MKRIQLDNRRFIEVGESMPGFYMELYYLIPYKCLGIRRCTSTCVSRVYIMEGYYCYEEALQLLFEGKDKAFKERAEERRRNRRNKDFINSFASQNHNGIINR